MTDEKKKPIGIFLFIVVSTLSLIMVIGWVIPPMVIQHSHTPSDVSNLELYKLTIDRTSNLEIVIWQSMTVHLVGMVGIFMGLMGLARKMHLVK